MAIYDVTDLEVYERSLDILKSVYKLVSQIPDLHQKLKTQIINSSEAVPPLIAEGFGKRSSPKEFKRFLKMAMGSSDETITHAREIYIVSNNTRRIDKQLCIKVGNDYKVVSKQLNKLIKAWIDYNQTF